MFIWIIDKYSLKLVKIFPKLCKITLIVKYNNLSSYFCTVNSNKITKNVLGKIDVLVWYSNVVNYELQTLKKTSKICWTYVFEVLKN